MSSKRYDPAAALRRTLDASTPPAAIAGSDALSTTGTATESAEHEYLLISVRQIDPSSLQSRLVFREIEELVESIRGDGATNGVGIVEPILVRPTEQGRYEILDGERRFRAAMVIASERAEGDFLMPARVFHVSDSVGTLIGQAANVERDSPRPLERAISYRVLRDALERDAGRAVGIRKMAGIGWHRRSQVRDYLAIGDRLTTDVLKAAGVMDSSGRVDEAVVTRLTVTDLLAVASAATDEERIVALRAKADRARGIKSAAPKPVQAPPPTSPEVRLTQMRDTDGLNIRVRVPLRTLAPAAARQLLINELSPAMLALVAQAEGHVAGEGYHGDFQGGRTMLVLPCEVEQLSAPQLEALSRDVTALAARVRRAARFRRGRADTPAGGA